MNRNLQSIVFVVFFLFSSNLWATECQWWQTKVKASIIPQHKREGQDVSKHSRQEHCREKWKGADLHIKQFRDDPIRGWDKKGETFKKWSRSEIHTILPLLPKLPPWTRVDKYTFLRADRSIHQGNSATSELTNRVIILYDKFFTHEDKLGVIGHEVSHFVFQELSNPEISEFEKLSGWTI